MAVAPDGVILLDWGERTGQAPPAVEFAWYVAMEAVAGPSIEASRDELLQDFRDLYREWDQDRALKLAFIGVMLQQGWKFAINMEEGDEASRAEARENWTWWIRAVTDALETWAPPSSTIESSRP